MKMVDPTVITVESEKKVPEQVPEPPLPAAQTTQYDTTHIVFNKQYFRTKFGLLKLVQLVRKEYCHFKNNWINLYYCH